MVTGQPTAWNETWPASVYGERTGFCGLSQHSCAGSRATAWNVAPNGAETPSIIVPSKGSLPPY
jgi:hypothetical protein